MAIFHKRKGDKTYKYIYISITMYIYACVSYIVDLNLQCMCISNLIPLRLSKFDRVKPSVMILKEKNLLVLGLFQSGGT